MEKSQERQSNFEWMRIVSMFFIVIWHIIMHGKLYEDTTVTQTFIANCILAFIIVHVNSLVFVTGYFNHKKENINIRKVFSLVGTAWFYKVLFLVLFCIFGLLEITRIEKLEELLPLDLNNYWFLNKYIALILLSPFINRFIKTINQKEYSKLLIISGIVLSIIPTISMNRVIANDGYTLMNFLFIYLIGAYFSMYPIKENDHFKKLSEKKLRYLFIGLFFIIILIRIAFFYLGKTLSQMNSDVFLWFGNILIGDFYSYSSPLVILQTILYCLFFETIHFKSKFINFCAKSTFGIYLIHDNHFVRQKIYKWLRVAPTTSLLGSLKILLIAAIIIYFGSFILETLRRIIVKILKIVYTKGRNIFKKSKKVGE